MTRPVVIHSTKRVFDGFFKLEEVEVSFERFDGRMSRPVKRVSLERGDSVAAVIYNRESRRAIFVEQFKYPTYEHGPGWLMETVAGMAEAEETPEAAIRREVLEEVGYEVDALEEIATFYLSPGGSSERVLLYYAEVTTADKVAAGGGVPSEDEDIRTIELSREQLLALMETGEVQDAKTLVGIQWLLGKMDAGLVGAA